jgi:hypothetical protein
MERAIVSDIYAEVLKALGPGTVGVGLGYYVRRRETNVQIKRTARERWEKERQSYWSPLLESALEFRQRLGDLKDQYIEKRERGEPLGRYYPADFCELYVIDGSQIDKLDKNLEEADPIQARKSGDLERTRVRTAHQLTYAVSSLYRTAKYLGAAQHALTGLREFSLMLPEVAIRQIADLILDVRKNLQGKGQAAGIFSEQQEAIGEVVWDSSGKIVSNHEFRKRLFEPGWEQFVGLFRFYVHFHQKLDHEVKDTICALGPLIDELIRLTDSEAPENYKATGSVVQPSWPRRVQEAMKSALPSGLRSQSASGGRRP